MDKDQLHYLNSRLKGMALEDALPFVLENIDGKKVFSTSFGIEDQLLTHYIHPYSAFVSAFTLDTGRQFNETYEVFQKTQDRYPSLKIKTYFPDEKDVREYVAKDGVNGFYDSVESRKECCRIRKVVPLQRAIEGARLWITGLRAQQSPNRETMDYLEWDDANQLVKYNPLLHHTLEEVEQLVDFHKIPLSTLYAKGYLSVGCAPCTRAIGRDEDFRAGRWWWEGGKKECGLHIHATKNF